MPADYEGMTLEERVKAAEAELELYKAGLVGIPVTPTEPVEPKPPPPVPKPKVIVVNKSQQVVKAGLRPRPAYSRVVSMVAIAKFQGNPAIGLSVAIGNAFIVLDVWVRVRWDVIDTTPELFFRLTTGIGVNPSIADVEHWEAIVPCIYEGANVSWIADQQLFDFHWSMDRRFAAEGRRLALWTNLVEGGACVADVYASYRISEG